MSRIVNVPDRVTRQLIPFQNLIFDPQRLGEGGYGFVSCATWVGNTVAVKQYKSSDSKKAHFQAEVEIISRLNHGSIVEFYGACNILPELAIVMEFLGGGSMHEVIHGEQLLTSNQKKKFITDCLKGLKYLHRNNVAHRDLKSKNVVVCVDREKCKLVDFGLSLLEIRPISSSAADLNRPATNGYAAPEVVDTRMFLKLADWKRADVYSMAVVLFECITKTDPYRNVTYNQIRNPTYRARFDGTQIRCQQLRNLVKRAHSEIPLFRPSATEFLANWEQLCDTSNLH